MKDEAEEKLGGSDKSKEQVDKAAKAANDKTGGKFDDQVDKGSNAAKEMIDRDE